MAGKTELYVIIAVMLSTFLLFGNINSNFDGLFNMPHAAEIDSGNNSTMQNATLQINGTYIGNNSTISPNSILNVSQIIDGTISIIQDTINAKITNQTRQIIDNISNKDFNQTTAPTSENSTNNRTTSPKNQSTANSTMNTTTNNINTTSNQSAANTTHPDLSPQGEAAAGETKTPTKFTLSQIKDAAARVKAYIENNHRLPNYVTIGTIQIGMPDFLKLLTAGLLQLKKGITTPITLKSVNAPAKPIENIKSGNINKADYLDIAKRVNDYINANGALPNYANSNLGKLGYESLIYMFSRILSFEKTNKILPRYVTVKPWSKVGTSSATGINPTSVPASLQGYLQATANCEVNDPQIQALAAKITKGATSTYGKAVAIFNWVRDNIGYSYYYNTRYGAVGTLQKGTGNCCDTSHLLVALSRAAGIPARYVHGYCEFSNGKWYGHVWAQLYINGKWYNADAISTRNNLGVINNWDTDTATIKGRYTSLPF